MSEKDATFEEGTELTDDMLEGVAGGVISPGLRVALLGVIGQFKRDGKTLDDLLAAAPGFLSDPANSGLIAALGAGATIEEVEDFVRANW